GAARGWDCMLTVAAIDSAGAKASFSSYGATMVDLGAPGVGVNSTLPGNTYGSYSGTSMATPHVSGAVALCASMNPSLTAFEIRSAILGSTSPTASLSGITVTGGRLNVGAMTGSCATASQPVEGAPSNLTATALSASSIRVDWTDGTSFESYQEVQQSTGDCTNWATVSTVGANSTSTIVSGLQPSTSYCYRVRAGNRYDTGNGNSVTDWSNTGSATTDAAPSPYVCGAVAYTWLDYAGGTGLTMSDDSATNVTLPFAVTYYGDSFTSIAVGSNGLMTFGSTATSYTNDTIPVVGAPDGLVAPFWDDLNPGVGGTVLTRTIGTAPSRTFVVSWVNVPHYSVSGSALTFQAAFDEATGSITFNYLDVVAGSASYDFGASATIGVESPSGTYGTLVGFNRASLSNRTSIRCAQSATTAPSITTTSLPTGYVQNAYAAGLTVVDGTAPYTWAVTSGSLPAGLSLSSTSGVVSGTPTAQGTSTFAVRVTDAAGRTATSSVTVAIDLGLYIVTSSLPGGGQNVSYSTTLSASLGTTPYTWTSTTLPAGLYLTAATGELWGTPTTAGTYSITFTVTDSGSPAMVSSRTMSLSVSAPPVVSTTALTAATVNIAISRTLTVSSGTSPYAWALTAGSLPPGVTLSTAGVISGTPTATGLYTFTVQVTDALGRSDDQVLSLSVDPLFVVTTSSLPDGGVGYAYSATLTATGGSGGYTWSTTGTLPAGLTLGTDGVISGTPTTLGTSTFTVVARDTSSRSSSRSLSLTIAAAPTVTTTTLNSATTNSSFSYTLAVSAGAGTKTWAVVTGSLPTGATLSTGGVLSGTVATAGSTAFTVRVTDALGRTDDQDLTLTVLAPMSVTTSSLPAGTVGVLYSLTLGATGGSGTYTWAATGVPSGLTLDSTGLLSGTPTTAAVSTVSLTATDTSTPARTATRTLTLTVSAPLAISTTSLNSATTNSAFSYTLATTGGSGTKTWSVVAGAVPAGASLSSLGVLSGTVATAGTYSFTVRATDGALRTADQALSLIVVNPVTVTTASLAEATVNSVYSATVAAAGGSGTYTWSATGLPTGLSINSSTGVVSGTPTAATTVTVTFTATDNGTPVRSASRSLSLVVVAPLAISTSVVPGATQGAAYSTTLASTGGSGTKTWSVSAGALPSGLSMSTTGVVSGTPTVSGSFSFTATVVDGAGRTASSAFSLTVSSVQLVKVSSLSIVKKVAKTGTSGSVTVTVVNASGVAVASVTVTGNWTVTGVAGSSTKSGLTNTKGQAVISSNTYTGITGATVQFCVTSLAKTGFTFDTSGPTCASFIA
ncbi:MAG: putative Ig domain-containing protein, partial [Ilumatobacteraceae bacterium]